MFLKFKPERVYQGLKFDRWRMLSSSALIHVTLIFPLPFELGYNNLDYRYGF